MDNRPFEATWTPRRLVYKKVEPSDFGERGLVEP